MYLKAAGRRKIACEVYFPAEPAEASRILVELFSCSLFKNQMFSLYSFMVWADNFSRAEGKILNLIDSFTIFSSLFMQFHITSSG